MLSSVARLLAIRLRTNLMSALVFLILASCAFVSGCASVAPVVKIGLVGPFEGQHRAIGYDVIYSARLAIRQANEAGGIGRYRVGLVALDDFGDPEMAPGTAAALVADPAVVAVVGHWLPDTTSAAGPVYAESDLPFVATDAEPFDAFGPSNLPPDFRQAYAEVTPFDEVAGPYAGAAYDAVNLLLAAISEAEGKGGKVDRQAVSLALEDLTYEGLTGPVYLP